MYDCFFLYSVMQCGNMWETQFLFFCCAIVRMIILRRSNGYLGSEARQRLHKEKAEKSAQHAINQGTLVEVAPHLPPWEFV